MAEPRSGGPLAAQQLPAPGDIESILGDRVASGAAVGLAVGVVDASGHCVTATCGYRGSPDEPVDAATVFEIGSLTKLFTATLLADLVARGRAGLGQAAAAFLPATVRVPARGREITLADLATHSSGLPRLPVNLPGSDTANLAAYSLEDLYAFLSSYQLPRAAGSQYEYSNVGYALLGHMLSLREQRPFPDLVTSRILAPLGMNSTGFTPTPAMQQVFALPHDDHRRPVAAWETPVIGGAGGLLSTLPDMMRFACASLPGNTGRLGTAMALAKAPRFTVSPHMAVGIGWHTRRLIDHDVCWHSGETAGSRACIIVDDTAKLAAVVLSNCILAIEDIALHLLDSRAELAPPRTPADALQLPADVLDRYTGVYELDGGGTVTVTRNGERLIAAATGLGSAPLYAQTATEFIVRVIPVSVTFDVHSTGRAAGLVLHHAGQHLPARRAN